jgi:SAM-dependent methyltransferase
MNYRILYALGITPWERMAHPLAPVGEQISRLFARQESDRQPFGRALDVGCGSGIWAVKLAQRGWEVTGIDFVPKAIRRARKRAEKAGVEVTFFQGDVTMLQTAGVGSGFRFFLDFGCFHDALTDEQRAAEGREVTAVAAPDATLLLIAWTPAPRHLLPRGASRSDIEAAFPEWQVVDEEAMDATGAPGFVQKAEPRFYRLRRG